MLVIEPTAGNSVWSRSERHAYDPGLERAGVTELVSQPCPGQGTVSGVSQIPPPAVFEGPDDVVVGEINVDAEGIKHEPPDVSASTITGKRGRRPLMVITIDIARPYGPPDVQFSFFGLRRFSFLGLRLHSRLRRGKFFPRLIQLFFQRLNALLNLRCRIGQSRRREQDDRHPRHQNGQCQSFSIQNHSVVLSVREPL